MMQPDGEALAQKQDASENNCPYHCIMSKKRYKEIEKSIRVIEDDHQKFELIMESIKNIMRFDPDSRSLTKERVDKVRVDRQRRAQEQGISIYKLLKYDEKRSRLSTTM